MIENKLQTHELVRFLRPFLCLASFKEGMGELEEVLGISIGKEEDIVCQTKRLITYKEYRVDITYLRWIANFGFMVQVQFKAKQRWSHGLFCDQNKEIMYDLQEICANEILGLKFSRCRALVPNLSSIESRTRALVCHHDSRAFNPHWSKGSDISPLILVPDAHDGNCFVELLFNPSGYMRQGDKTILRKDWLQHAVTFSITRLIEREAQQRLGKL